MKISNLIGFLIGVTLIGAIVREKYYDNKFNATKLNVSIEELKNDWGNPDYEFVPEKKEDTRVIKYDKSIFGQYIFLSDEQDKLITGKFFDD